MFGWPRTMEQKILTDYSVFHNADELVFIRLPDEEHISVRAHNTAAQLPTGEDLWLSVPLSSTEVTT